MLFESDSLLLDKIQNLEEYQLFKKKTIDETHIIKKRIKEIIQTNLSAHRIKNIAFSIYGSLVYGIMSDYSDIDIFFLHEVENEFSREILKRICKKLSNSNISIQLYNTNKLCKKFSLCTVTNLLKMEFVGGDINYYKSFFEKVISIFSSYNIAEIFSLLHDDNLFMSKRTSRKCSIVFFSLKSGPGGIFYINSVNTVASWYKYRNKKLSKKCIMYLKYL
ncbi:MAG: hypothetical protein GY950_03580, partial [bacterium]|nr:hypothetical protein [bacterium]